MSADCWHARRRLQPCRPLLAHRRHSRAAQAIGRSGESVLLVDADIGGPRLSGNLTGATPDGLVQILADKAKFDDVVWKDPASGGSFLPAGAGTDAADQGLVSSRKMKAFMEGIAEKFDYVIVRLPPAATCMEAASAAGWVDAFVLVVAWRTTERAAVAEALASSRSLSRKTVGAVLNKVSPAHLWKSETYKGRRSWRSYRV